MATAAVVEFGFAFWVFAVRPGRAQNRRLAGLVLCDAVPVVAGGAILFGATNTGSANAAQMMGIFGLILGYPFHVWFLTMLDSPFARPLRPWAKWLVAAFAEPTEALAIERGVA